ncbi:hypothetical protein EYC58_01185 [Candidatus Saccharibacteria bacterium]|nr:MAG: hypothetical protein EYC58_01185 [Candidatus Saccharibacteria bacterium]
MSLRPRNQDGFTIIEIGIIVPILIVFLLALFNSLWLLLQSSSVERTETNSAYDIQAALSIIEKDVMLSSQFLATTDSGITDAYPPTSNGNTWSYLGENSNVRALILKTYATTTNTESNERQPIFLDQVGCTAATIYYNDVLDYNTIYFVKNDTLYRRKIINTSSTTCNPAYQKQSCPSLETLGTGTRSATCQADDEPVAQNVSGFTITYYDKSNSTTPIDTYASGADPALLQTANAVKVTITISRKAMGKTTAINSTILIPRLNISRTGN